MDTLTPFRHSPHHFNTQPHLFNTPTTPLQHPGTVFWHFKPFITPQHVSPPLTTSYYTSPHFTTSNYTSPRLTTSVDHLFHKATKRFKFHALETISLLRRPLTFFFVALTSEQSDDAVFNAGRLKGRDPAAVKTSHWTKLRTNYVNTFRSVTQLPITDPLSICRLLYLASFFSLFCFCFLFINV